MKNERTWRRHWKYQRKHGIFDNDHWKKNVSRKTKKDHGTRSQENKHRLEIMRLRQTCSHDEQYWETKWSYIPGEYVQEPDYDYCSNCGLSEMEIKARSGHPFYSKRYPKKKSKLRWRAIQRAEEQCWHSYQRKYANGQV